MQNIIAHDLQTAFNIAIVASRFYQEIVEKLCIGAVERLKELSFPDEQITVVWVPGIEELPLVAKRLAKTQAYEAIVCLGVAIRGETDTYNYICQQASIGCQQVALETDMPIIFGVLPTKNTMQALARAGGAHGNRGRDAVDAAYEMVSILRQVSSA